MKKLILIALIAASAVASYAQGTVNFNNKVNATVGPPPTPAIDAPVSYASGTTLGGSAGTKIDGSHTTAWAALYGGAVGTPVDQLVLLAPALQFRTGTAAGYVNTLGASSRAIPGVNPGDAAVVQVRAWDTANGTSVASYEAARGVQGAYFGASDIITIAATGGAGAPPSNPANIYGLNAFAIAPIPEPGTIALGFLGLGAMFVLRRKK